MLQYIENADKCDVAEGPWNLNNPVKASRSHQELHKELLLTHKQGLVLCCKPELQMVLERRKREQTHREEGEQSRSPLEQVLLKHQQKNLEIMKEKEEEQKLQEEVQLLEFVRVRQNLRKVHSALQKHTHP
ncbi:protein FAM107B-like [Xyrauchen texanus]|uniref:protein FAM107B-like n=1 Tax=Xyrauchen texanus TaxID=154827 RepID=UPI002241BFA8|nr:protein FAM107B-like [Xyrauchen texanus]